jgi:hypothetical protein
MGHRRRKEDLEIFNCTMSSNRDIAGVTLGQVCSANVVMLDVACHRCARRGRYRVTRLIDRYGAAMKLTELKDMLSSDCPYHASESVLQRCGVYFPGWKRTTEYSRP